MPPTPKPGGVNQFQFERADIIDYEESMSDEKSNRDDLSRASKEQD